MPGSPTENRTIVRLWVLAALAAAMSACAAAPPVVSHERSPCGARERLVCDASAGGRRCACIAAADLERVFGGFGTRID